MFHLHTDYFRCSDQFMIENQLDRATHAFNLSLQIPDNDINQNAFKNQITEDNY